MKKKEKLSGTNGRIKIPKMNFFPFLSIHSEVRKSFPKKKFVYLEGACPISNNKHIEHVEERLAHKLNYSKKFKT